MGVLMRERKCVKVLRKRVNVHDSIFNANCNGPVTVLVAKDRVLAHNPLGAVYSRYWQKKLKINDPDKV